MTLNRLKLVSLGLAVWLLGACAISPERDADDTTVDERRISTDWVRIDQVRDFRVLDSRNLVLYAPSRRNAFHVELMSPCHGLRFVDRIALRGRQGRLGGFAGDSILLERSGAPDRCPVTSVRRLDEAGLEELLVFFQNREDRRETDTPAAEQTEVEIPRRVDDHHHPGEDGRTDE